jgi:hypothetical protein
MNYKRFLRAYLRKERLEHRRRTLARKFLATVLLFKR